MHTELWRSWCRMVWLPLLVLLSSAALADSSQSKLVDGMTIYLGVVPAEIVRSHPKEHAESAMHSGTPAGVGRYHVIIALFDSATGQRISDAEVKARVAAIGLGGNEKKLEVMQIAGTSTYGNFFDMAGAGPFRITVQLRRPNVAHLIEAHFEHRHQ